MRTLWVAALSCLVVLGAGCRSVIKPGPDMTGPESYALEDDLTANDNGTIEEPAEVEIRKPPLLSAPTYTARPSRPPVVIGRLHVPLKRQWRHVVIHHSATASGSMKMFDRSHKKRGWLGVGYHFVIGNGNGSANGTIEVTFRWEQQKHGAHAGVKEYNTHGIGVCLVGDFEKSYPTKAQVSSLVWLVDHLQKRCGIPIDEVLLHRHVKNTRCPGGNFPFFRFISLLEH